jgi:hypothetical protein
MPLDSGGVVVGVSEVSWEGCAVWEGRLVGFRGEFDRGAALSG